MSGLNPLPPHVVHSSNRLTHAQAHSMLSDFLQNAENDAAYRPDSTLTDHGPQSASIGASPNLTLHHLKRILLGIEGKRVGGEEPDNILFGDLASANAAKSKKTDKKRNADLVKNDGTVNTKRAKGNKHEFVESAGREEVVEEVAQEQDGWQDKDDYELAQEEEHMDLTQDAAHPAGVEQPADPDEAQEEMEVHVEKKQGLNEIEKKARKQAKKDRHKEEKRKREHAKATK